MNLLSFKKVELIKQRAFGETGLDGVSEDPDRHLGLSLTSIKYTHFDAL